MAFFEPIPVRPGEDQFILAEVSVTLDENDIRRAQSRADLLAQATTTPVRAAAIGAYALEIWPETPILPKPLFSWRRLPV